MTVQAGGSAILDCRISLLQDKTVSFLLLRPYRIYVRTFVAIRISSGTLRESKVVKS